MPLPHVVARFNARYTNKFIEPAIARLPGFIQVIHQGRRTGTTYVTPLLGFRSEDTITVVLTYGPSADWVLNAHAAPASVRTNAGERAITQLATSDVSTATELPGWLRRLLRIAHINDVARVTL